MANRDYRVVARVPWWTKLHCYLVVCFAVATRQTPDWPKMTLRMVRSMRVRIVVDDSSER